MPAIARPGMLKSDRNGKFREFVQEVSNCVFSELLYECSHSLGGVCTCLQYISYILKLF